MQKFFSFEIPSISGLLVLELVLSLAWKCLHLRGPLPIRCVKPTSEGSHDNDSLDHQISGPSRAQWCTSVQQHTQIHQDHGSS